MEVMRLAGQKKTTIKEDFPITDLLVYLKFSKEKNFCVDTVEIDHT